MSDALTYRCRELIVRLGLGRERDIGAVRPLTGGVASDIAVVAVGPRRICVKFALGRLKVAEEWHAPVHRNAAEYAWLGVAARIVPQAAIGLFGRDEALGGFAMEFLASDDAYLWKTALLEEQPDRAEAARVGDMLGRIHAASARADFDRAPFANCEDFRALRTEPYLIFTAGRAPEHADALHALADMLYAGDRVLVHGDVSPKNIFFRASGPVILDAECATMGDASFDPAFCLNHLLLKAVHLPGSRARLIGAAGAFWRAYAAHVDWEDIGALEARVCALLPALMLARVDGKSPVEYLTPAAQDSVRGIAGRFLRDPASRLDAFAARLAVSLREQTT